MRKLIYLFLTVLFVACSSTDSVDNESNACNGDNPIYLANNGLTIKACEWSNAGDAGLIDGITYTVVDEAKLRDMVANQEDLTKVVTTKVTDMNRMFYYLQTFNQDISSWDVSNVTNMEIMFDNTNSFNQPIGNWDLSSVNNLYGM